MLLSVFKTKKAAELRGNNAQSLQNKGEGRAYLMFLVEKTQAPSDAHAALSSATKVHFHSAHIAYILT